MALQFLYSSWWENEIEHTVQLATAGVDEADIEYILHTVAVTDRYDVLPNDEENEELANTLYLRLPSSAYAIIRTGWYTVQATAQENNIIVHAFIQEKGEEISPMLYAINNCFRISLTKEEQDHLLTLDSLPATPFPRPQFKLSQAEVRKFFSQGRLRTLACLLQAVIDSYGNQRVIVLNDNYHSLKYWFYGIHSCLPQNRTAFLTYSTYAFHKPDDCILICSAPGHSINFDELAQDGNFVIDNLDDLGCGDIESAKFASSIVREFWEDMTRLPELLQGIEALMDAYGLNVANAAGLYKLVEFDFEWFNSAHEIHYFLGKVGTIDKDSLEMISHRLWDAFQKPDFKFKLNADNLPILAYMFRNTNDEVRWEIISYIDNHKDAFGYHTFPTFDDMYRDLVDRLAFVTEFIPIALMQSGNLCEYCESRNISPKESAAFLRIIVDNYSEYEDILGTDALSDHAIYLLERILQANALDTAYTVCSKALDLPYDFLRYVLVQGILNVANTPDDATSSKLHLPDEFVYRMARLLIVKDPSLALELVKNHAREGKYSESTLALYNNLCHDFPQETADFEETLHARAVYSDFVTDSVFYKFASLQNATREELTDFFTKYYVTGKDRHRYFETKLLQHLNDQLPVNSIETADYFLKLLVDCGKQFKEFSLFEVLASYLLNQQAINLFDHYNCNRASFDTIYGILLMFSSALSPAFKSVATVLSLSKFLENDGSLLQDTLRIVSDAHFERFVEDKALSDEFGCLFIEKLIRLSSFTQAEELSMLAKDVMLSVYRTPKGKAWIENVWHSRLTHTPESLYPLTARFIIFIKEEKLHSFQTIALEVLDTVPSKKRKDVYLAFLSYANSDAETSTLKDFLANAYYRNFSALGRIFARPKRKLFGKLSK